MADSLRLGALNDIDYGTFVNELKRSVEPILEAYHYRQQILESLLAQRGPEGVRKASVYLLGAPFGRSKTARHLCGSIAGEAATSDSAPSAEQNESLSQTDVFAKILGRLLHERGAGPTRLA